MSTPIGSSQWMYATGAEVTQQSLKFNDDESQYLSWTPAAAGNRKTWTWSAWVKRGALSSGALFGADGSTYMFMYFTPNSLDCGEVVGSQQWRRVTTQVFRDSSAWYHIVFAFDSTQATAGNRVKLYVNGSQVTAFSTSVDPSLNYNSVVNTTIAHSIGSFAAPTRQAYFDGYLSDVYFIDGQALDASSFGETVDGYWKTKDYAGSYGTNGFHLTFEDDVVSEGFNTVTYRGDGNNTASISGLGFSPDLLWIKNRTDSSNQNLMDSVRGASVRLLPSATLAEVSSFLGSFDGDGFTFSGGNDNDVNQAGDSYVAWAWDAGSGSAASNTDGSITSTVKANPDYGFSVVSYVGSGANATVGHGLSSAPDIVILKNRSIVSSFLVRTQVLAANQTLLLENTTTPIGTDYWQNTQPDSSVFSVSSNSEANGSGNNLIAYCFAEVAGYSSIGSYSGTGSNGNKITTGFAPAFILLKRTDAAGEDWLVYDNTRNPANLSGNEYVLRPNTSGAEQAYGSLDFDSDGFTLQTVGGALNASGGTYIYMAFADTREAAFWKDVSGQGNHWTPNNLDYRDSLIDSPANNFAVMNPIGSGANIVYSEGSLKISDLDSDANSLGTSTFSFASGKYYFEHLVQHSDTDFCHIGVTDVSAYDAVGFDNYLGSRADQWSIFLGNGEKRNNGSSVSYGSAFVTDDIMMCAVDMDSGKIWWGKNGTWFASGDPAAGTNAGYTTLSGYEVTPAVSVRDGGVFNFGQDSTFAGATTAGGNQDDNGIGDFKYAPPSGYLALCTANLPTPSIVDGSEHFNTVLYTGTGATQSITGFEFQPDLVWIKPRSITGSHGLFDAVRGIGKSLRSHDTRAEDTASAGNDLISFNSDGFSVGPSQFIDTNTSGVSTVAWNWKAGGTAVSNTDGSITSQVSANTTAGFSIVSYTGNGITGATVGHSLGVKPDMFIVKNRTNSGVNDWSVYHSSLTATHRAYLYKTDAAGSTSAWNSTEPTSSVFTLKNFGELNSSGDNYIAYCFANTEGYLKAGSYTGNGSSDGPFIFLGFRPSFFLTKRVDSTSDWQLLDTSRDTFNAASKYLKPNSSAAESTGGSHDFVSNGFKIRNSGASQNASGGTYIYLAFASSPFKYSTAK